MAADLLVQRLEEEAPVVQAGGVGRGWPARACRGSRARSARPRPSRQRAAAAGARPRRGRASPAGRTSVTVPMVWPRALSWKRAMLRPPRVPISTGLRVLLRRADPRLVVLPIAGGGEQRGAVAARRVQRAARGARRKVQHAEGLLDDRRLLEGLGHGRGQAGERLELGIARHDFLAQAALARHGAPVVQEQVGPGDRRPRRARRRRTRRRRTASRCRAAHRRARRRGRAPGRRRPPSAAAGRGPSASERPWSHPRARGTRRCRGPRARRRWPHRNPRRPTARR